MRSSFAIGLLLAGSGLALTISKDASCGGQKTCQGSAFGNCCSQYGWCGSGKDYCGTGCQSAFGNCDKSSTPTSSPPTSTSRSTSTTLDSPLTQDCDTDPCSADDTPAALSQGDGNGDGDGSDSDGSDDVCSDCQTPTDSPNPTDSDGASASADSTTSAESTVMPDPTMTASESQSTRASTTADDSGSSSTSTAIPTSLPACLSSKQVPASFPSSSDYAQLAKAYNNRLAWKPAAIVLPTTVRHVQDAVICAGAANVKVQAKSGGHSYAAFSLGGKDGSMIVDLQKLQGVSVNAQTKIATVGGGVRLGNLASQLYSSGRAVSHGTCPGVGIGGHFTHGGFGYSSRSWGLALDSIDSLDVVLADGTTTKASSSQNTDLFYALRGAGESFGIITTFYLKTQAAPSSVVNWGYTFADQFSVASKGASTMQRLQEFARNASVVNRKLGMGVYLDGETFSVSGTYFGSLAEFNSKVKPELLRGMPTPASQNAQEVSWIQSLTMLSGDDTIVVATDGSYDKHDNFLAKSVTVPEASPITNAGWTKYFQTIIDQSGQAGSAWFSIFNLYGGPDSQINSVSATSTAYSDRSALWVIQNYGYIDLNQSPFPLTSVNKYLAALGTALSAGSTAQFGAYANYVDPTLTADQAHTEYYGSSTYEKLLSLKKTFDSKGLFWNPQAIGA